MARLRAPLALTVAITGGCSLFASFDDLSNGASTGTGDDAGVGEAGAEEGGADGSTSNPDGGGEPPGPPKWRRASSAGPARHSSAMAYDETRQRMVLFGGWAASGFRDTWEWDGAVWAERTLPESPSTRRGHRMVHDVARKTVFLFGGTRGAEADQWSWDGVRWRELTSATLAPTFQTLAMAYDTTRNVAVLFGGNHFPATGNAYMRDETWEWNGTDWTKRAPPVSPIARRGHAMAFDAARSRVVLFGGRAGAARFDTWEYDGTTWIEREPIDYPKARFGACMAYDPRRKVVVMYGGSADGMTNFAETWLWDGSNWSAGPSGPPAVRSCAMAWDDARAGLVMFGGTLGSQTEVSSETWVLE